MSGRTLLLLHGWGFDYRIWDAMLACLPGVTAIRWDRGYFGKPIDTALPNGAVAVGHSLGAMLLDRHLPAEVPLVAINGFDRFAGDDAVAPRVIARMRTRFADDPRPVLNDFRTRCGAAAAAADTLDVDRLAADLALLADTSLPPSSARRTLTLQGDADAILPETLRAGTFAGAGQRLCVAGGHLLPVTHPHVCAAQIRAFAWA